MSLRELVFDIAFKGNMTMLSKAESALDKFEKNTKKTGKGIDNISSAMKGKLSSATNGATSGIKNFGKALSYDLNYQIASAKKSLVDLSQNMEEVGKKTGEIGKTMSTGITAPLVVAGTTVGVLSENMSGAMTNIQSQTGASGAELAKYESALVNLAGSGSGSFDEVGTAIMAVSQNLRDLPTSQVEDITNKAMGLSKTFGDDVGGVTRAAQTLMQNFGVTGAEAMDMITAGYQKGLNYSGEYLDTLNEYGPQFQSLGFSGEDMFNTLISGAESGAWNLDKVGDAVKEFNIRAKDGSDTTKNAFSDLGFNADEMGAKFAQGGDVAQQAFGDVIGALQGVGDEQTRNALGVALFGTQYEDLEGDVIAALGGAGNALGEYGGKADEVAENSKSSWDKIKGSLNTIAGSLNDLIAPAMETVAGAVQYLAEGFSGLSPGAQGAIVGFLGILAAIGPVLIIVSKAILYFGKLKKAFGIVKGAMLALSGPVGIVIAILAGLVIAGIAIYKNWDTIQEKASQLGAYLSGVWNDIKTDVVQAWTEFRENISNAWEGIRTTVSEKMTAISEAISAGWEGVKQIVISALLTVGEYVVTKWESIKTTISTAMTGIWTVITTVWSFITNSVSTALSLIWSVVTTVWNTIKSTISSIVTGIWTTITTIWNNIKNTIVNVMTSIVSGVVSKAIAIKNALVNKLSEMIGQARSKMNSVKTAITSPLTAIPGQMANIGRNIVQGLIGGIANKLGALKAKALEIASTVKNAVKGALDINSPSRVFMNYGGWIGDGLTIGMDDSSKNILASSKNMAMDTMTGYESGVNRYSPSTTTNNGGNSTINTTVNVTVQGGNTREIGRNIEAEMERVIKKVNKKMSLQVSTVL